MKTITNQFIVLMHTIVEPIHQDQSSIRDKRKYLLRLPDQRSLHETIKTHTYVCMYVKYIVATFY